MTGNSVLLETSVIVRHFRKGDLSETLSQYEELFIPQPALGELYYGAYKSHQPEKKSAQIERFLAAADVIDSDNETSRHYGRIATQLANLGSMIPQNDIWMAALSMQCGLPPQTAS